jgi:hypothetical protein
MKKNENLKEYHKILNAKMLNDNPHYNDDVLNDEINKFLNENKEFQLLMERNKKRQDKLKNGEALEDKEPRYLKLYIDDLTNFIGFGSKQKGLILAIFELGYINIKGHIELTPKRKKIIAKKLNQKDFSNYYKTLKQLQLPLVELNNTPFLAQIKYDEDFDDGIERYYINPFIVGNGSWANVKNRRLRIILDYQGDDRRVTIENLAKLEDSEMNNDHIKNKFMDETSVDRAKQYNEDCLSEFDDVSSN